VQNELYISPAWDFAPLESINGKANILSEMVFSARYPTGKIPKKSSAFGKTFVCRRGCNTRTATYTEEFIWEDIFHGMEEDVEQLSERLKTETMATRKASARKRRKPELDFEVSGAEDEVKTPRKKQKFSSNSTPKKPRTPSKLLTPSHKRHVATSTILYVILILLQSCHQETAGVYTTRDTHVGS
jgi:origin recognition complex subunit 1